MTAAASWWPSRPPRHFLPNAAWLPVQRLAALTWEVLANFVLRLRALASNVLRTPQRKYLRPSFVVKRRTGSIGNGRISVAERRNIVGGLRRHG